MPINIQAININKPNSVQNSANCRSYNPSFGTKVVTEKTAEEITKIGDKFTSAWQRLISGVTALLLQPAFDLNNKKTDEETRKTSCARTLGKIIAGTTTGVLIRWACVKATENFTKNENTEKYLLDNKKITKIKTEFTHKEQCLLPEKYKHATYREIKNYRGAIGTLAAVGIMIFTNFLIDAPLTTFLTNVFTPMLSKHSKQLDKAEGGNQ